VGRAAYIGTSGWAWPKPLHFAQSASTDMQLVEGSSCEKVVKAVAA
jgi:hypothetical protein